VASCFRDRASARRRTTLHQSITWLECFVAAAPFGVLMSIALPLSLLVFWSTEGTLHHFDTSTTTIAVAPFGIGISIGTAAAC
jgi:hypothetical protein